MKLIKNLILEKDNWKYTDEGLTNFLTNAGRGVNDGNVYTWVTPNGLENENFAIFGDGNLLENDAITLHRILHRIGCNDFYLISMEDFRREMRLVELDEG